MAEITDRLPHLGQLKPSDNDVGVLRNELHTEHSRDKIRILSFPEEPPIESADVFQSILKPIEQLLPSGNISLAVKAYEDKPHGRGPGKELSKWIKPSEISSFIENPGLSGIVNTGLSGVIRIEGDTFFIPTLDLEFPYKDNDLTSLASEKLASLSLTGFIVKSGYSYHYIGDFFMPYGQNYWKLLGSIMQNLVYDTDYYSNTVYPAIDLGKRLVDAQTFSEAQGIAIEVLERFPSLPSGMMREGLLYDIRWIGHKILPIVIDDEKLLVNTLRVSRGKGYNSPPLFDLEIRGI